MNGYNEFRRAMKGYKNPIKIGTAIGELVSIKPVTIAVIYGEKRLQFTKFKSMVSFDYVKEEDIGNQYTVQLTEDNNTLFVMGQVKYYEDYYVEEEGE